MKNPAYDATVLLVPKPPHRRGTKGVGLVCCYIYIAGWYSRVDVVDKKSD